MDLIPILLAIGASTIWIVINRSSARAMRRRLGDDVTEIVLYRRGAVWASYALIVLAALTPLLAVWVWSQRRDPYAEELLAEILRPLWFLSMAFQVGRMGRLLVGSEGFSHMKDQLHQWRDVESIAWDRDIGQRQWGVSIVVRPPKAKTPQKLRLYVRRQMKSEVEKTLGGFHRRYLDALDGDGDMPELATTAPAAPAESTSPAALIWGR